LQGFEACISDKNETLHEQESKIVELEQLVEDSLDKANKLKAVEKEKKDLAKQVKNLQLTMQDWETRQHTNMKLISGLEKVKAELEKKVKDFEENHTGADQELYENSVRIRKLEKEVKQLQASVENKESQINQVKSRLEAKAAELADAALRADAAEQKTRDLERVIRCNPSEDVEELKRKLGNQERELEHLRRSLTEHRRQLSHFKGVQMECSMASAEAASLKKLLPELKRQLAQKDAQMSSMQTAVKHELDQLAAESAKGDVTCRVNQILAMLNSDTHPAVRIKEEPAEPPPVRINTDRQLILALPKSAMFASAVKEETAQPEVVNHGGRRLRAL
jgi:chromosome segregation ATPase